jgi:hypothetical protein
MTKDIRLQSNLVVCEELNHNRKGIFQFPTKSLANIASETKKTVTRLRKASAKLFKKKKCMR